MKFDVCIPTKNSGDVLEECLEAITRIIPYNRILVVDGYSSDDTVRIAQKFGCEIHYCRGKLGEARTKLMNLVKTDLFFFIDSDVIVNKKWFNILINTIDENMGAMNGFALPRNPLISNFRKVMLLLKMSRNSPQRGFTSNTILRRKVVENIMLPDLKRCEDIILQEEIEKKGWKWKFAPAFCLHLKNTDQILKEAWEDLFTIAEEKGLLGAIFRL